MLLLAGCNRDVKPVARTVAVDSAATQHPAALPAPKLVTLPPQKIDTVSVEGTSQQMTLRLIQPTSTMPFYTYVPPDIAVVDSTTSDGEDHFFIADFAGKRNDQAFVLLHFFPADMPREKIVAIAKAYRDSHQGKDLFSSFDLRMHNDRYYFLAQQYPHEYGDGFAPRAARILSEWQWLDVTSAPRP